MKVLVIPEDPTLDQYILKPIVTRIFADLGKSPRIGVLSNPRLRGVAQALDATILADIVSNHPMIDLFLVLVDRDADIKRPALAQQRETEHKGRLFVCLGIEEIEVWMLAIHRERLDASWKEIRTEVHPKERFAQPFLEATAPRLDPGGGRAWAMRDLGARWRGVLQCCGELEELRQRVGDWVKARPA